MPAFIIADKYIEHVAESLGIPYNKTTRLIIDARAGIPVRVHVELIGDDTLLEFKPAVVNDPEIKRVVA